MDTTVCLPHIPVPAGYRFPAEWQPHAATWTNYPYDASYWQGALEGARADMSQLIKHIADFEPVKLGVVDEETEQDARQRLTALAANFDNISFQRRPYDDIWFRDSGPLFVSNGKAIGVTDWKFNGWGKKYRYEVDNGSPARVAKLLDSAHWQLDMVLEGGALDVNSRGICLTTRSCLLSPERNPLMSEADYATVLGNYLGIKELVWLEAGLEDDHTDGHIDTIVRFCDDDTIVYHMPDDTNDYNYAVMQKNLAILQKLRQPNGTPYRLIALPQPSPRYFEDGTRFALSYANFYIGNGFVIVPQYGDACDDGVLELLRPLFPQRQVIGSPSSHLITGGGSFHCVTQQQPQIV